MHLDELAERAYQAYGDSTGWTTWNGRVMPPWPALGDRIQAAWRAAAAAVEVLARECGGDSAEQAEVLALLREIRSQNMSEASQIAALDAKFTALVGDVRAALEELELHRDNLGPEGQAALDTLSAKVTAFNEEVGDRDNSEAPAPEPTPEG